MGRYTCLKCMFEAKLGEMKQHCAVKHHIGKTCSKCPAVFCSAKEHQEHWTLSGHPEEKSTGEFSRLDVDYILSDAISSDEGTPNHSNDDSMPPAVKTMATDMTTDDTYCCNRCHFEGRFQETKSHCAEVHSIGKKCSECYFHAWDEMSIVLHCSDTGHPTQFSGGYPMIAAGDLSLIISDNGESDAKNKTKDEKTTTDAEVEDMPPLDNEFPPPLEVKISEESNPSTGIASGSVGNFKPKNTGNTGVRNVWRTGSAEITNANTSDVKLDKLRKSVKRILNRMTPETEDALTNQLINLMKEDATSEELYLEIVSMIFDMAISGQHFSQLYCNLCHAIIQKFPDLEYEVITQAVDGEGNELRFATVKKTNFRTELLKLCQQKFRQGTRVQIETEKLTQEEVENLELKSKKRILGNINFIGQLFLKKIMTERIMHDIIKMLIGHSYPTEEDLEALCFMFKAVGETLDRKEAKAWMDQYFARMRSLSELSGISSRIKFMLLDVIELRKNNWKPRLKKTQQLNKKPPRKKKPPAGKKKPRKKEAKAIKEVRGELRQDIPEHRNTSDIDSHINPSNVSESAEYRKLALSKENGGPLPGSNSEEETNEDGRLNVYRSLKHGNTDDVASGDGDSKATNKTHGGQTIENDEEEDVPPLVLHLSDDESSPRLEVTTLEKPSTATNTATDSLRNFSTLNTGGSGVSNIRTTESTTIANAKTSGVKVQDQNEYPPRSHSELDPGSAIKITTREPPQSDVKQLKTARVKKFVCKRCTFVGLPEEIGIHCMEDHGIGCECSYIDLFGSCQYIAWNRFRKAHHVRETGHPENGFVGAFSKMKKDFDIFIPKDKGAEKKIDQTKPLNIQLSDKESFSNAARNVPEMSNPDSIEAPTPIKKTWTAVSARTKKSAIASHATDNTHNSSTKASTSTGDTASISANSGVKKSTDNIFMKKFVSGIGSTRNSRATKPTRSSKETDNTRNSGTKASPNTGDKTGSNINASVKKATNTANTTDSTRSSSAKPTTPGHTTGSSISSGVKKSTETSLVTGNTRGTSIKKSVGATSSTRDSPAKTSTRPGRATDETYDPNSSAIHTTDNTRNPNAKTSTSSAVHTGDSINSGVKKSTNSAHATDNTYSPSSDPSANTDHTANRTNVTDPMDTTPNSEKQVNKAIVKNTYMCTRCAFEGRYQATKRHIAEVHKIGKKCSRCHFHAWNKISRNLHWHQNKFSGIFPKIANGDMNVLSNLEGVADTRVGVCDNSGNKTIDNASITNKVDGSSRVTSGEAIYDDSYDYLDDGEDDGDDAGSEDNGDNVIMETKSVKIGPTKKTKKEYAVIDQPDEKLASTPAQFKTKELQSQHENVPQYIYNPNNQKKNMRKRKKKNKNEKKKKIKRYTCSRCRFSGEQIELQLHCANVHGIGRKCGSCSFVAGRLSDRKKHRHSTQDYTGCYPSVNRGDFTVSGESNEAEDKPPLDLHLSDEDVFPPLEVKTTQESNPATDIASDSLNNFNTKETGSTGVSNIWATGNAEIVKEHTSVVKLVSENSGRKEDKIEESKSECVVHLSDQESPNVEGNITVMANLSVTDTRADMSGNSNPSSTSTTNGMDGSSRVISGEAIDDNYDYLAEDIYSQIGRIINIIDDAEESDPPLLSEHEAEQLQKHARQGNEHLLQYYRASNLNADHAKRFRRFIKNARRLIKQ